MSNTKSTRKERILDIIWEWIFFILTLALFALAFLGLGYLIGNSAIVIFIPLFFIWAYGLVKKEEKRKRNLKNKVYAFIEKNKDLNLSPVQITEIQSWCK